jgi:hypothetical protein
MKTIIAGSRDVTDLGVVIDAIRLSGFDITEVVSGGARGPDETGEWLAKCFLHVPIKHFPPDWLKYRKAAGPIRNAEMANYADALIAIWDGKSRGTADMIEKAINRKLKLYVHQIE